MRNKPYLKHLLFLLVWLIGSGFFTLSARYQKKVEGGLQDSEELKVTEKAIDVKILDLNQRMIRYLVLMDVDIKFTPEKTEFTKNKEKNYVQLESYSFIPRSKIIPDLVGLRYKTLRLYFNGSQLSKIETRTFEQNFYTPSKLEMIVVDPSPNTEDTKDITITRILNEGDIKRSDLTLMENTSSRPLRIEFKRNYYQKNLIYFEKLYRLTEEFQNRIGGDSDKVLIDSLKDTLSY